MEASSRKLRARTSAASLVRTLDVSWREAGKILLLTRVVFLVVAYAGAWFLATSRGGLTVGFLDLWARWDATHFFAIAERGYAGAGPNDGAFFPGFPLLLRLVGVAGLPLAAAGLIVSAGASLVAFAFLFRLAEHDAGAGAGRRAVLYLALFPTAVFLVAPYSEALYLAGAIPAFFFARRRRWELVGPPAALAVATRAVGLFLVLGLVVEYLSQHDFARARVRAALGSLALAVLPVIAYGAYLGATRGDVLFFLTAQRLGWYRDFTNPVSSFVSTWNTWSGVDYPSNWLFAWRAEIVAAALGVGFVAWALRKRAWGYAAYMGAVMASLLTSTWYFSIPRMLLSLFPAVVFLAAATRARPGWHDLVLVTLAPLATLGVVVFTSGAWFF
ncbi:MAG: mannosyltransferase family protein [Actinomycetota bacterium]